MYKLYRKRATILKYNTLLPSISLHACRECVVTTREKLWPRLPEEEKERREREEKERSERRRRAKERQQKIMEEFVFRQKQFMQKAMETGKLYL